MIHLSGAINSGASTRARRVQRSLDCYRNWKSIVAKNLVTKNLVTPPATPPVQTQEWGYIFLVFVSLFRRFFFLKSPNLFFN